MSINSRLRNSIKIKKFKKKIKSYSHLIEDYLFYTRVLINKNKINNNITIVSASDNQFYESLCQLLESINNFESDSKIIIYDIGLTKDQFDNLNKSKALELRKFNFKDYPEFIGERDEFGKLGAYAWKPTIINEVLKEKNDGIVLWLDAGNILTGPLNRLKKVILYNNFYSPLSSGSLSDWCHPKTLDYFNVKGDLYSKPNLTGGLVGLNSSNYEVRELIQKWYKYSNIKECISPEGSDRNNHRQDQSLLSILFYLNEKIKYSPKTKKFFSILVNQNPGRKIYLLDRSEKNNFKIDWLKNFDNISTNTISYSNAIWILNIDEFSKIEKKYTREKKLLLNIFSEKDLSIFLDNHKLKKSLNTRLYIFYNKDSYKEIILNENVLESNIFFIDKEANQLDFKNIILSVLNS
tara:strand:+ start:9331 stop:10554 length:1224 start_codon:yes stop_codon:yes gene_type:complete